MDYPQVRSLASTATGPFAFVIKRGRLTVRRIPRSTGEVMVWVYAAQQSRRQARWEGKKKTPPTLGTSTVARSGRGTVGDVSHLDEGIVDDTEAVDVVG